MYESKPSYFNRKNALSREQVKELLGYEVPDNRPLTSEEVYILNGIKNPKRAATPAEIEMIQLEAKRLEVELGYIPDIQTILQNLNLTDIGTWED